MRYKASRDGTMTLDAFLDEARALEVSEKQAKDIEPLKVPVLCYLSRQKLRKKRSC